MRPPRRTLGTSAVLSATVPPNEWPTTHDAREPALLHEGRDQSRLVVGGIGLIERFVGAPEPLEVERDDAMVAASADTILRQVKVDSPRPCSRRIGGPCPVSSA